VDPKDEEPKPTPASRQAEAELPKPPSPLKEATQEKPKEATTVGKAPDFKGYQRKTQISGSISRTGKSALAVENSAMGRYQAALSRAVELEWQRNCVRYRDYITPGFLTARFVVEQNGKVRSVNFVEPVQSSEVQKGFTLNAIRQAAIPAMPADLKKELGSDPLELIFNFYF
jgi:outer membrane biosynthesis protein TonB